MCVQLRLVEMQAIVILFLGAIIPPVIPAIRHRWWALLLSYIGLCVIVRFRSRGPSFNDSHVNLTGKIVIVTGANSGIGLATSKRLAQLGATVILACRSAERAQQAISQVAAAAKNGVGSVEFMKLDLQSFASVRSFVTQFQLKYSKLDILINNAGIMMCPFQLTPDGYENQFQSNHLGHFLLTILLIPQLRASGAARVINVSGEAHAWTPNGTDSAAIDSIHHANTYNPEISYGVSKLSNIQFSYELNRRAAAASIPITSYSLHPGIVQTNLGNHLVGAVAQALFIWLIKLATKTPLEGSQSTLFVALSPHAVPGEYHFDCRRRSTLGPWAFDATQCVALWDRSIAATGIPPEANLPAASPRVHVVY